jgi:hypothetical protein
MNFLSIFKLDTYMIMNEGHMYIRKSTEDLEDTYGRDASAQLRYVRLHQELLKKYYVTT